MIDRIGPGTPPTPVPAPVAPPAPAPAAGGSCAVPAPTPVQDQSAVAGRIGAVAPGMPVPAPGTEALGDAAFIQDAFRRHLGREIDEKSLMEASMALANGHPREAFLKSVFESEEYKSNQAIGFAGISPTPLEPLSTVPHLPMYDGVKLPLTNLPDMVMQALREAKNLRPDIMEKMARYEANFEKNGKNVQKEKQLSYELMTTTIGILRANGIDASRVIAFPDNPVGHPGRYAFDQLRIGNGPAIDIMGGDEGVCFLEQEAWSRPENAPTPEHRKKE